MAASAKSFQVGSNANETIGVTVNGASAKNVGADRLSLAGTGFGRAVVADSLPASGTTVAGKLTVTGANGKTGTADVAAGDSAKKISDEINKSSDVTGVKADARTGVELSGLTSTGNVSMTLGAGSNTATISANITNTSDLTNLANSINAQSGKTGITAALTNNNANIKLVNEAGEDITIDNFAIAGATGGTVAVLKTMAYDGSITGPAVNLTFDATTPADSIDAARIQGQVQIEASGAFQVSASAANMVSTKTLEVSKLTSVADIDISSQDGAQNAISVIDAAIASIDKNRASLGAVQNRFENTISNLQNISENVSAARGRIQDTDFAAETANLSKNQVLQQAGTAILAQANQLPQAVLSLLR